MAQRDVAIVRRIFFRALLRGFQILWPALSGVLTAIISLGVIVGLLEDWGVAQGVYFSFTTGLTIGYGDLAPSMALTKLLAVLIGLLGIVLTGLVAALAVTAFQATSAVKRTAIQTDE